MDLLEYVTIIRERLPSGYYVNEATVSQGIFLPTLNLLGWPAFVDTQIVCPAFSISAGYVDYALCQSSAKPLIFVDVRPFGDATGIDQPLFDYAVQNGIPFIIVTDGQEWHFYLPTESGVHLESRVCILDLTEGTPREAAAGLTRYLDHERVLSGQALQMAREDFRNADAQRHINEILPKAWAQLLVEQDELLLELLADKVADLCGYKPDHKACAGFLATIQPTPEPPAPQSIPEPSTSPSEPESPAPKTVIRLSGIKGTTPGQLRPPPPRSIQSYTLVELARRDLTHSKPMFLEINGQRIRTKKWVDLIENLLGWLVTEDRITGQHLPLFNHSKTRDKYLVSQNPQHADPSKTARWKSVHGFWVDVNYSANAHVKNIMALLEQLKRNDLSIRIELDT